MCKIAPCVYFFKLTEQIYICDKYQVWAVKWKKDPVEVEINPGSA